jgi:proton-translocating NADH-quinone oxidoreductase chain L
VYLILFFLPLISVFIAGFFGRFIGFNGVKFFLPCNLFLSNFFSIYALIALVKTNNFILITFGTWIQTNLLIIPWVVFFDILACVMLVIVTTISALVHLYSCEYIKNDPHFTRFILKLSLFTFFIIVLVTSNNFLVFFLGWEGVGFCSYLLITFWFTRIQANKAAIKAILINRFGDIGLILALSLLIYTFQTLDFLLISNLIPYILTKVITIFAYQVNLVILISCFLFLGIVGKSAQLGLHSWLPDAIEGPTPVSALLHAATIVTAGVFLFIRSSFVFEYSVAVINIIVVWGVFTAFFSATCALFQNDIKKIIAYSTCSQLGYIVFACGISQYSVSLFHLFNHAFFKALLFLSAGVIIHAFGDEQDLRRTGLLYFFLPSVFIIVIVGNLALLGWPFLTGFYSKDFILELSFSSILIIKNESILWLGLLTALLTALYSMRLLYLVFLSKTNLYRISVINFHKPNFLILFSLVILFYASIFIGYLTKDLFIGLGSNIFEHSLFLIPTNYLFFDAEIVPFKIKLFPFFLSCAAIFSYFFVFSTKNFFIIVIRLLKYNFRNLITFFIIKWFFDKIFNEIGRLNLVINSYILIFRNIDKGFIEFFGPYQLSKFFFIFGKNVNFFHTGYIFHYACILFSGLLFFLSFGIFIF